VTAVPDSAVALVKMFEGLSLRAYRDSAGFPTIGYGHLLARDAAAPLPPGEITAEEAEALLLTDLTRCGGALQRLVQVPLAENETAALLSFVFNLGAGAFQASTLRAKLNRDDREGAADEFPRWVHAGGRRLRGLIRRRAAERRLFLGA
jgi:lysozyme